MSARSGWPHVGLGRLPDGHAGASVHFSSSSLHSFLQSAQACGASRTPVCFGALCTPDGAVSPPSESAVLREMQTQSTLSPIYWGVAVLCWPLPRSSVNQLSGPTPLLNPPLSPPHASRHRGAPSRAPCAVEQLPLAGCVTHGSYRGRKAGRAQQREGVVLHLVVEATRK